MRIEIICTGDEVLSGKIVNTNFSYMTQKLADVGLDVSGKLPSAIVVKNCYGLFNWPDNGPMR